MSVQRAARAALAERSRFFCGLVALIILAGFSISCGSSSSSSNASHVGYISIPNQGLIAMVRVNNSTGAITIGTKTPSVEGTGPTGLALNPSGKFLYAGDVRHHKITTFNVAADGSLTQSATDTPAGTDPSVMVVDPSGKYLLVTNPLDHNVSVFSMDSATGALNQIGTAVPAGTTPAALAFAPAGNLVYVSDSAGALISGFSFDPATGDLKELDISPFPARGGVSGLAIDSGSRFLYAANTSDSPTGTVSIFSIEPGTGKLIEIFGSPVFAGTAPRAVAIDPFNQFLYVANQSSSNVSAFTITGGTGALTQITGSPFGAGTSPLFALFDPSGTFLYVGNEKSKNISGYTFDSTTGKLTAISGSPFSTPAEPGAMVIAH